MPPAEQSTRMADPPVPRRKRDEFIVFSIIAAVIWPFVTVAVVGGYGFLVWMYQLINGPPGPPG